MHWEGTSLEQGICTTHCLCAKCGAFSRRNIEYGKRSCAQLPWTSFEGTWTEHGTWWSQQSWPEKIDRSLGTCYQAAASSFFSFLWKQHLSSMWAPMSERGYANTLTLNNDRLKLQRLWFINCNPDSTLTIKPREGKSSTPAAPLCHHPKPCSSSPQGLAVAHRLGKTPLVQHTSTPVLIKFLVAAISKHICRGHQDIIYCPFKSHLSPLHMLSPPYVACEHFQWFYRNALFAIFSWIWALYAHCSSCSSDQCNEAVLHCWETVCCSAG